MIVGINRKIRSGLKNKKALEAYEDMINSIKTYSYAREKLRT
jgi:hypothetical protein